MRRDGLEDNLTMEKLKHVFGPCRGRAHCDECQGAYFDVNGYQVVCTCPHHTQGELIAEYKIESKQKELF